MYILYNPDIIYSMLSKKISIYFTEKDRCDNDEYTLQKNGESAFRCSGKAVHRLL